MEEEFYASIKLKSSEEIFTKVSAIDEGDDVLLVLTDPVIITEYTNRNNGNTGYKVERWIKTSREDTFIIRLDDVLTISESLDPRMISMHELFISDDQDLDLSDSLNSNETKINRSMGYLGNVNECKNLLEKIFKEL